MQRREQAIVKLLPPTQNKRNWLDNTAQVFTQAVQYGLDIAEKESVRSRNRLHKVMYRKARSLSLPSDYARMSVNTTVSMVRAYYALLRAGKQPSFPQVRNSQGIGLGINAYKVVVDNERFVLRVYTGERGTYVWLPLCVPAKYCDKLQYVYGDARIFKRKDDWYVTLPLRVPYIPTVSDSEPTFIGVDLGIVRHATVVTPDRVMFFNGKPARHKREHFTDIRSRYQKHSRNDRVKDSKGKESDWITNVNHKISRSIVSLASEYPNPVIVLERLDGIRSRVRGSKRFKRMVSSWTFRQLTDFIQYKAERENVRVVFCDPRGTSKTCPKCGHATRSNRPQQGRFRCVSCNYEANADYVAARNIAAAGARLLPQEPPDTARTQVQTEPIGVRPDGVKDVVAV